MGDYSHRYSSSGRNNLREGKKMSGTKVSGKKAAATNKRKYGEDFYIKIGALGGKASNTGGFTNRELARRAGRIGGRISRRGKAI